MLVPEETSRAWSERRVLLEDLQQQQLEMLDRLKDTEIGKTLSHGPENIIESRIRVIEDAMDLAGKHPVLVSMKDQLNAARDDLLNGYAPQLMGQLCTPTDLYESRAATLGDAIRLIDQQELSLSEEDLASLSENQGIEL